jgi:GNAT superfamily N-acetyltransferase
MQRWAVEHGTFWASEASNGLPPLCPARIEVAFAELESAAIDELAVAMNLSTPEPIRQRLHAGRRCFYLKAGGQIATYGWVTHGAEYVGELARHFHLRDDEAYVWDCGTVPAWRGHRCYSALLSQILHRLHGEGTPRIWIGAARQNQPSIRGIANAGFTLVVEITYRRFYRLTWIWFHQPSSPHRSLVSAAYRILIDEHERRLGRLAIGYQRKRE